MPITLRQKILFSLAFTFACTTTDASESRNGLREVGSLVYDGIPEGPFPQKERLNQFENVRSARLQGWLKGDQGLLISTRFGDSTQLHTVAAPLHDRHQITFYDEPIGSAHTRPKRNEIVFLRDSGGNEFSQIYHMDLGNRRVRLLTDGKSRNESVIWNRSGSKLTFSSTARNGKDSDIYVMDPDQNPAKADILLQEGGTWRALSWSHDDQRLLVRKAVSANENFLFIFDTKSKKLEPVLEGGNFAFGECKWTKDDKGLFVLMDREGEFQTLYRFDLKSKELDPITDSINWDIEDIALAPNGQSLAFVANEDGIDRLYIYDVKGKSYRPLEGIPAGVIGKMKFHPQKSHRLAFTLSSSKTPGDVYEYDLQASKLQNWTLSETGGLAREDFVEPQLIHYPTFDTLASKPREIPAFYYRPKGVSTKTPVVIMIHGGPESQFRPGFNSMIQFFVDELKVSVIAPNVRGSSGYGKTYLKLDNAEKREDSVKDIGSLLDWIGKRPDLDSEKVVVMGGSYGGYMVLASLVHYSDRLAGGVDNVGISHFVTFLNNTKSYRQDLRRVEYGDERDPAMLKILEEISPLTKVDRIKKPLLVVQGLNDPRVPVTEAEQIVKAVRANSIEAWYLLAKDEGHGFKKKPNHEAYLETSFRFIEKLLKTAPST